MLFLVIPVLVVAGLGAWLLSRPSSGVASPARPTRTQVLARWEASDWQGVILTCDQILLQDPLDAFSLGMKGVASFYRSLALPEGEERAAMNDSAIIAMRKALATQNQPDSKRMPKGELEYILAKAYFQKGDSYYDLAALSMTRAAAAGYSADDSHEYLAMSYSRMGQVKPAIAEFGKAMTTSQNPVIRIAAAKEYLKLEDFDRAESLLIEASASREDAVARESARALLANLYLSRSKLSLYEVQVGAMLAENPDSAEAHYLMGLLFQARGDPVHARAEWRRAVSLDPMHAAARQKLAERS
ncbi:MAG: hypothetical protein WCQ50_12550 [Spirochaetota bacterium]